MFRVVRQRGILMQEAVPTGGAMCAVLGMDGEKIAKICDETEGIVSVANYNCPGQIVITGEEGAVAVAAEKLKEAISVLDELEVRLLQMGMPFDRDRGVELLKEIYL